MRPSSRYAPAHSSQAGKEIFPGDGAVASPKGIVVLKSRVAYGLVTSLWMLVGWASTSHALTLGDLRGGVIVGRALDVSVLVRANPGEEVSATCFKAEVSYADAPQPDAAVTVRPLANAADGDFRVRVQSAAPVNEPVVTVELRANCAAPLAKRYVVLADFPVVVMPEPQSASLPPVPAAVTPIPAPVQTPPPAVQTPSSALSSAVTRQAQQAPAKPRVARRALAPKRKAIVKKPAPTAAVTAPSGAPAKSALKLEALNLPTGQTDGLASAPLSLPSPEAVLQASQIQALQDELKQLRAQSAQTNAQMVEMRVQLQRAQSERVSLQLFYAVLVLLVLCAAGLSWLLWQRYREQSPQAFRVGVLDGRPTTPEPPGPAAVTVVPAPSTVAASAAKTTVTRVMTRPSPQAEARAVSPTLPATLSSLEAQKKDDAFTNTRLQSSADSGFDMKSHDEVDLDLDLSNWGSLDDSAKPTGSAAESVLDIRQQAEFFVSLGQTERALVVLKKQIAEGARPDPSIYLDLLSLFHSLGSKTDFREYRAAFNQHFNCVLPDFPAYHLEGLDLLAYPQELAQLTQVWNHPEAVTYLQSCIYRTEQASAQPSFELGAFRDLLLLLSITEQVVGANQA